MKRILIFASLLIWGLSSCTGQKGTNVEKDSSLLSINDSIVNKPKTNVIVNKEYDDDGNLIKYDSTYTYFYSNVDGNKIAQDSIMNMFKKQFNEKYFFSDEPFFDNMFFQDSLLMYDFYKEDFFEERFKNNMKMLGKMFKDMDAMKNQFYENQMSDEDNKL